VDGKTVAETGIDRTVPYVYSIDETLDIGEDRGTPIIEDYADRTPFKFNGRIDDVTIELGPQGRRDTGHTVVCGCTAANGGMGFARRVRKGSGARLLRTLPARLKYLQFQAESPHCRER
jgi:hypothetical protein